MYVVPNGKYTLNTSAKTITLLGFYTSVSLAEICQITNLTTGDVLFNVETKSDTISLNDSVITYKGGDYMKDTDILRIEISERY